MNSLFDALKNRNLRLLFLGDVLSVFGDQIGLLALLWFIMIQTNDPGKMGFLSLCFGIPGVISSVIAGALFDKWRPARLMIASNLALGIIFTAIPCLYLLKQLSIPLLDGLIAAAGFLAPFSPTGVMVLLPRLAKTEELAAANSIFEILLQSASLLGPVTGGFLIAKWGGPIAIFADAITFFAGSICFSLLQLKEGNGDNNDFSSIQLISEPQKSDPFWRSVAEGFRFLFQLKTVLWITISAFVLNLAYGQLEILLPLFVHSELHADATVLGSFWMIYFLACIVGAAFYGILRMPIRQGIIMASMILGWGMSLLPVAAFHTIWIGYISLGLAGFWFGGYPPAARTAVQKLVPVHSQGRVFAIRAALFGLANPVGSFLAGVAAKSIPTSEAIGWIGFEMIGFGILVLFIRPFRSI